MLVHRTKSTTKVSATSVPHKGHLPKQMRENITRIKVVKDFALGPSLREREEPRGLIPALADLAQLDALVLGSDEVHAGRPTGRA